jgi:hypothetical protein
MTSEKQLPFGQNTRKEVKDRAENIEGHSGEVGLHARKNGNENDKETQTLRSSECINGRTMGRKKQNEK